jgi:surface antigen
MPVSRSVAARLAPIRFSAPRLAFPRQWSLARLSSSQHRRLTHVFVLAMGLGVVSAASFSATPAGVRESGIDQAAGSPKLSAAIVPPVLPITHISAPPPTMELALPVTPPAEALGRPSAAKPAPDLKSYIIEDGDNPFDLAAAFGITDETLLAANGLGADTVLQIGQKLLVPPVSGVMVSTQPGDTLRGIADQWKIDALKLATVNKLDPDAKELLPGEALMLPGAQPPVQIYPIDGTTDQPDTRIGVTPDEPKARQAASPRPILRAPAAQPQQVSNTHVAVPRLSANNFPYGQCTWFAAQARPDIGSRVLGNAASWLYSARAAGLATGSRPEVGAVVVYQPGAQGAAWTGHVAVVTSVSGNGTSFTIREMNYAGWAVVSTRSSWTGPGVSFIY